MVTTGQIRAFAIDAHGDQQYGNHPYSHHLDAVVEVLQRFGYAHRKDLIGAAYLHDVVEDTHINIETVVELVGWDTALLVWAVTHRKQENHLLTFAATAPKIAAVTDAPILKLADRIANVEASQTANDHYIKMYRKEQPLVRQFLYGPNSDRDMEDHLDRLLNAA